jgi:hypothetical protein
MPIVSRASLIIIVISAPALAMGNPGYYYPSYYPPHNPYKQDHPPDWNNLPVGAKLDLLDYHSPTTTTPTQARPAYTPPAYTPPAYGPHVAYEPPTYHPPAFPTRPPPAVRPDQAYDLIADVPSYNPQDSQAYKPVADIPTHKPHVGNEAYRPPVETTAYKRPTYNQVYKPTSDTQGDKPPAETPAYNPPNSSTTPMETPSNSPMEETAAKLAEHTPTHNVPTPPKSSHGKPSPLPNHIDRRNAPRVPRHKIRKTTSGTAFGAGHSRRFPFLKKRQHAGQHTVVPVTVNMITGIGHSASTSSVPMSTSTNVLAPGQSSFGPGNRVDTSQAALSLQSNPEATMPSAEGLIPPVSSSSGSEQFADLDTGEPRNKATVIASIIGVIVGLVVVITVVKLTSNVIRNRKHAREVHQYDEHLSSKEGLIPDMSEQAHFETHDVIITSPDGSEISPLSPGRGDSPSPPPFSGQGVGFTSPPPPMPTFPLPPAPAIPLSLPFVKLLSPTVNLAQQNIMQSRTSAMSETMSMSTTSTDMSERRPASDSECSGRQVSHRRMRSAPGSVAWSARSSGATGNLASGLSGEEGYWDSVDVCGSESVGRMAWRSSRGRSVAMSVMW